MKKIELSLTIMFMLTLMPFASALLPEPPRYLVDTKFPTNSGRTVNVATGSDPTVNGQNFQAALNDAKCGDTIILQAGATYAGAFWLKNAGDCNGNYIIIKSSALNKLPPQNTRVKPSDVANMPKIVNLAPGNDNNPTFTTKASANYYWLAGLEITHQATFDKLIFNIMMLGANYEVQQMSDVPHHVIIDRCYIHGHPAGNIGHVSMDNMKYGAVVDSYISELHIQGFEVQGIVGCVGPGPYKAVNNYVEAAGENIFYGGCRGNIPDVIPEDIEIQYNYIYKPTSWWIESPDYAGTPWAVKNLLELKGGKRALINGNILENSWVQAQHGNAIVLTPRSSSGAGWTNATVVDDITVTNNIIRHAANGINILGRDDGDLNAPKEKVQANRILIKNNIIEDINRKYGGCCGGYLVQITGAADVTIDHNTGFHDGAISWLSASSGGVLTANPTYTNNIFTHGGGLRASGLDYGFSTLDATTTNYIVNKNAFVVIPDQYTNPDTVSKKYPAGNYFPSGYDSIGFTSYNNGIEGDYTLLPNSTYKNAGTDGKDLGADIASVMYQTAGVMEGKPIALQGGPPPIDVTAPGRTNGEPTGTFKATNKAVLKITTTEAANCKYTTSGGTAYASMTKTFSNTGGIYHATDISVTPGNSYTYYIRCKDLAGNANQNDYTISFSVSLPDTTAPTISAVRSTILTQNSAMIRWNSNEAADSQVEYGLTTNYGMNSNLDMTQVQSHTVSIGNLQANSIYHYRVKSKDETGNLATSTDNTFSTNITIATAKNLIASYPFDEATGNTTNDYSGNENTASIIGALWTTGKYGSAISFDGVNKKAIIMNDPAWAGSYPEYTVEAWVKVKSIAEYGIVLGAGIWGDSPINIMTRDKKWTAGIKTNGGPNTANYGCDIGNSNTPLNYLTTVDNNWHHIALVMNSTEAKCYFYSDGELVDYDWYVNGNTSFGTKDIYIGGMGDSAGLSSEVDEIRIYGRALTQSEIKIDMMTPILQTGTTGNLEGDVNSDGIVNLFDVQEVIRYFWKSSVYNPKADLNSDKTINILDVMIIIRNM